MQWSERNEISLRNNLEDAEIADSAGQGVMQWSGRNEISPRNNLFRRLYRILLETRRAAGSAIAALLAA